MEWGIYTYCRINPNEFSDLYPHRYGYAAAFLYALAKRYRADVHAHANSHQHTNVYPHLHRYASHPHCHFDI